VEETILRICSHKGVEGVLVSSFEGVALKSTLSKELTNKYAGLIAQLIVKARSVVRTIDAEVRVSILRHSPSCRAPLTTLSPTAQNDLVFLRLRTKKHELMIAPDRDYLLIVIQRSGE
jgi:dynein light chain roadblock-type